MSSTTVQIVDYQSKFQMAFKDLNVAWIKQYFTMEASDYKALDHPETYILKPGGAIVFALDGDQVVGTCALIKMDHEKYPYELAKMAVAPAAQGKGIGRMLGQAIIDRAKALGAPYLYLESNTVLEPAIRLYRSLGFEEVYDYVSPYDRCNIQMGIQL